MHGSWADDFENYLVELRKINNLSQEDLAEKIGVSRQTLSKYETGKSLSPDQMGVFCPERQFI
ncbi:MAG: helix-turn-helix transcriptional regulator [Lachnospiraceae bacterium]|nr:helix-turn-helix transcriptional regulator [Lachnospiraceae bacterium]